MLEPNDIQLTVLEGQPPAVPTEIAAADTHDNVVESKEKKVESTEQPTLESTKNGETRQQKDARKIKEWEANKNSGKNTNIRNRRASKKIGFKLKKLMKRHHVRKKCSFVKQTKQESDGQNPDDAPDDEHWGRYSIPKGNYGGRSVGGKKPRDADLYSKIEAIDFTVHDTVEESMLARLMIQDDPKCCCSRMTQRRVQLWIMYALIGAAVSGFIGMVLYICGGIETMRVTAVKDILKKGGKGSIGMAWLSWTGSSMILCLMAVACVLIEPAAASSGIPGLIAYLNGVQAKGGRSPITGKATFFTSWETMVAKTLGMICSVPSGIAIGPEGPIIHISALIAHWTSILMQNLERKIMPEHSFSARNSEERDFLATGAACGICTAFRAPLAGVMFVVEEASSFFTTAHLEFTFLACLVSYWGTWAVTASFSGESTVKFKQTTGDFCSYHDFFDYVFFICLGILGGLLGALFNQIVEEINEFRRDNINNHAWRRVLEVIIVVLLTGTAAVCLPAAFMCKQELRAVMMEDSAGCLNAEDQFQLSHGTVSHPFLEALLNQAANCSADVITSTSTGSSSSSTGVRRMLLAASSSAAGSSSSTSSSVPTIPEVLAELQKYRSGNSYLTLGGVEDVVWLDNGNPYIHLHYTHAYACDTNNHEYNEMAMLWLNGGVKAVKVLLQRGFPHMLSWQVLLSFCLVYFFLAAITAGISVPAGLVVPMLLIGGSYGRLIGLGALSAKKATCADYSTLDTDLAWKDAYYWSTYVRWLIRSSCRMPDPGTYAIVGAASFLGGSGRITVMLATVLLELTDDASMIAPVGICCILSMLVGNAFNHGLYHGLIPVFNIPYLNVDPSPESKLAQVKDVMNPNPIMVPKLMHMSKVEELLERCEEADEDKTRGIKHHGFPKFYLEKYEDDYDPHVKFKEGEEVWWHENHADKKLEATIMSITETNKPHIKHKRPTYTHFSFQITCADGEERAVNHQTLRKLLGVTHHAFPVVSSLNENDMGHRTGILEGMISRDELLYALAAARNGDHTLHFIHLMKFCDRSPLTVYPNTRLSRAYSVFQKLGMRHLPVVNEVGEVQGIITRKNLMHYLLTDQKEQELIKVRNVQRAARRFLARRRAQTDTYFYKYLSPATTEMTIDEFHASMRTFRLYQDFLPNPTLDEDFDEMMLFVCGGANIKTTVSKIEFRNYMAKARQWRLKAMEAIKKVNFESQKEEQQVYNNKNNNNMSPVQEKRVNHVSDNTPYKVKHFV